MCRFFVLSEATLWYKNGIFPWVRIRWDEKKRQWVLKRRRIDFAALGDLFCRPYLEDQRSDDPEQYRVIGFAGGRITTFIIEYRTDELGEFVWVVTAWNSTAAERQAYAQEIG
jgi:uncharacterized DUF497 family protein